MGDHSLAKKLYNLTVQMACTVQVHVFYCPHEHTNVYSANKKCELELCKPYEQLNCTVFLPNEWSPIYRRELWLNVELRKLTFALFLGS